jgi:hypothetical protein
MLTEIVPSHIISFKRMEMQFLSHAVVRPNNFPNAYLFYYCCYRADAGDEELTLTQKLRRQGASLEPNEALPIPVLRRCIVAFDYKFF